MKIQKPLQLLLGLALLLNGCAEATEVPPTSLIENTTMPVTTTPDETPTPSYDIVGEWTESTPMLKAHSAHAVAVSDDAIYALAGTDEKGQLVLEVEKFDGNQWTIETILPIDGLNAPTSSIVDNKLYLVGGFTGKTNKPTTDVHVYDLNTKQWSMAAPMPNPRGGHAAVVLDGKIHLFGGGNSTSTIADHSQYDPLTNTWKELEPLPRAEGSPAAVVVNGKIYVIGGRSGNSDFGDVYIYDPVENTWSNGPSIEPRGTSGAVFYCDGIYLFGGESQAERKNLDSVLRLDLEKNIWQKVTSMPTARKFVRAVVFDNAVYIIGGSVVPANSHSPQGSASVQKFVISDCQ